MRRATPADVSQAMVELLQMRSKNPGKQMQYTDEDTARCYLYEQMKRGLAVVEQGYFILYDVGRPWYSKENFLLEELVIRIERTGAPPSVAIAALDSLKEKHGCIAVIAGDTQIGAMVPHYLAAGFTVLGTQLMKE